MKKMALSSVLSSTVTRSLLLATLGCAVMTTGAAAYDRTGYTGIQREIDARQAQQERRIQQGLRTGDLTWRERRALEAEQARIRALERQAQRDGHIDRWEAAEIRRAQDAASRHIYQERHDVERRGGWWGRRWW